jgi:hypothetical protein
MTTWHDLWDKNKATLKSGNPDLIYPGEVIILPDGSSYTIVSGDTLSGIAARQPTAPKIPEVGNQNSENQASDDSGKEKEDDTKPPEKLDYRAMAKPNPLSKFTSYTYGLSLYMVTAEALNNFTKKGGTLTGIKGKNSGVYIVAQSGGINSDVEDRAITIDRKLGGGSPGYDYYLDDFEVSSYLPGGSNKGTASTEVKFKITEPYGFSFLRDLSIAATNINKASDFTKKLDPSKQPNAISQYFIMGVKFYGYDVNGDVVTGGNPLAQGYDNGDDTDPNAVIQRFYPLKLSNMKFSLDGKAVTYAFDGYIFAEFDGYNELNSTIQSAVKISGATVQDALTGEDGIITKMNAANKGQQDRQKIGIPNELEIEFLDENGKVVTDSPISKGRLVDDETFAASTAPMTPVKSKDEVTVADSFRAVSINKGVRAINISAGTNIISVIENLIIKSSYIGDALGATKSPEAGENRVIKKEPTKKLVWFSIAPVVEIKGRDEKTNQWAFKIKLQIRPFDVPYLKTTVGSTVSKYPGPRKFYEYLLTGGNSEIISYVQEYNNMLFIPQLQSGNTDAPDKEIKDGTPIGTQNTTGNKGSVGAGPNRSSEINDLVAAQLYSPADNAQAKIKIMGDPDYLMSSLALPTITANKVYSRDGSINGLNGQVFIQITFNTGFDYSGETGLFNVDDRVQFYQSDKPKSLGIDGVVYRVNQISSSFSKGKFEQTLELIIVSETLLVGEEAPTKGGERSESSSAGANGGSKRSAAGGTKSVPQSVRSQAHDKRSANAPTNKTQVTNTEMRVEPNSSSTPPDPNNDPGMHEPTEPDSNYNNTATQLPNGRVTVLDDTNPGGGNGGYDNTYET